MIASRILTSALDRLLISVEGSHYGDTKARASRVADYERARIFAQRLDQNSFLHAANAMWRIRNGHATQCDVMKAASYMRDAVFVDTAIILSQAEK